MKRMNSPQQETMSTIGDTNWNQCVAKRHVVNLKDGPQRYSKHVATTY